MKNKKIAITIGDPSGIGPEIIIKALNSLNFSSDKFLLIGNKEIFHKTSRELGLKLDDNIEIVNIPCPISKIKSGEESIESGKLSFYALEQACTLANKGILSGIVTAPLSKNAINLAGFHYSGQTEILEKYCGNGNKAEMLFVANDFRVMLLTRHIPLADVSNALTVEKIVDSTIALNNSLINNFKISKPRIAICGLNPHAGEHGLLGDEENNTLIPAIHKLRNEHDIDIDGPFPADTIWLKAGKPFLNNHPQPYNAYVACYHDQGLIPIKLLAMDSTVNTTINLPILRTSPSHGTAFDIAGQNIANPKSMKAAIKLAYELTI